MSDIPVHLQRRFEQRWAARFVTSAESATPRKQWPEKHDRPVAAQRSAWLEMHESGTYVKLTQAGAEMFA